MCDNRRTRICAFTQGYILADDGFKNLRTETFLNTLNNIFVQSLGHLGFGDRDPKEIDFIKTDSIFFTGNYTFIDLRKDNIYNLISASCGNYKKEINSELVLIGYKLQQDSAKNLAYGITENRYLTLGHIKPDSSVDDLIIDLKTGTLK